VNLEDLHYTGGISAEGRGLLRRLARTGSIFSVGEAATILALSPRRTVRLLAHWCEKGWLARLRQGLYAVVPLESDPGTARVADPWVLLSRVFSPCYVGGWSACEHWELTEQLFRTIVIITTRRVSSKTGDLAGFPYLAKRIGPRRLFGTRRVWRGQTPVDVSDPHRTIVDVLDDPAIGGGIRHVAGVLSAYFRSEHRSEQQLIRYAEKLGNRTVFKRLGFLIERLGIEAPAAVAVCLKSLSSGYSRLDPSGPQKGKLLRRWRLLVNVQIRPPE
jgi:predicted transcriptional regulator of viral defense system